MSRNDSEKKPKSTDAFRLGEFVFAPATLELRDATGAIIHLRVQSAAVLAKLLERQGEVVSKSDLFGEVWQGTSVTDDSLVQCITDIRRCLKDHDRKLVQTVARRGYRIWAERILVEDGSAALPLPTRPSIAVLAFEDYSIGVCL